MRFELNRLDANVGAEVRVQFPHGLLAAAPPSWQMSADRAVGETAIRTTLSGLDPSGALASFDRMEDKVDQQKVRAAELGELESTSLEARFAELETSEQVEHELADLKAKKALASAATGWAAPT